jgi:hypothetical protein
MALEASGWGPEPLPAEVPLPSPPRPARDVVHVRALGRRHHVPAGTSCEVVFDFGRARRSPACALVSLLGPRSRDDRTTTDLGRSQGGL